LRWGDVLDSWKIKQTILRVYRRGPEGADVRSHHVARQSEDT
jgi:hypothetical protein